MAKPTSQSDRITRAGLPFDAIPGLDPATQRAEAESAASKHSLAAE